MTPRIPRWRCLVPLFFGPLLVGGALLTARSTPAAPPSPARSRSAAPLVDGGTRAAGDPQRGAAIGAAAQALVSWVREHGGEVSLAVLDPLDGSYLARSGAGTSLNPASNAKLFTAAVALQRLGPNHHFTTGLYGEIRGDRVGDLVLRGTGDPALTTADLAALCRTVADLGVRRVEGRILVDGSAFDAQTVPPAFDQQPNEWASFRAPVSAIALERNAVTAHVVAGRAGSAARVWFEPPGLVVSTGAFATAPPGRGQDLVIDWKEASGTLSARLSGSIAEALPELAFTRRIDDPTLVPGRVLRHLLEREGIEVRGGIAAGGSDVTHRLATHRSPALGHLIAELGKMSDNFYAEMLFKALGSGDHGEPASFARAAAVVAAWVRAVAPVDSGFRITNGSGLFDANRASAETIVQVLAAAYRDPALQSEYVAGLAIGGVDGTLASRFRAARAARTVRAKTGTLARADALSGYVFVAGRSAPIVFSILVNGVTDHAPTRSRIDRVVEAILALGGPAPPTAVPGR